MQKPVDKLSFWKKRIDTAVSPHYSVYIAHEKLWNDIYSVHKELIKDLIPKDAKVLDAGCAYGRLAPLFNNYVGIDFSPDFIELARKNYPDKEFLVGNLKYLPFKAQTFDFAVCISIKAMIIDNLGRREWLKMEKELKRVSNKILILEYTTPDIYEIL